MDKQVSMEFTNKVQGLNDLDKYIERLEKIKSLSKGIDTGISKQLSSAAQETNKLSSSLKTAFTIGGIKLFINEVKNLATSIGKLTNKSATYAENLNLLDVAFNNNTKEADKFVNKLSEMYGLDESWGYRTVGIFKQLSNAMGLANEIGTKLSNTMTQFAIDVSSLYNIDTDSSVSILQSALAGQTKPARRLGADITQTTLQTTLDEAGIQRNITNLSYVEKRLVIVASLLNQVQEANNDWGRTIESVANQTRILKEQWERLTRAIGNVFLPIVAKVLPYLNAILMVLTEIISLIARLFGYKASDFDYFTTASESVVDFADGLGVASDNAKKLKQGLRGFDKLNVISTPTASSSGAGGGGLGVDPSIMDMANKAMDDYMSKLTNVKMKATEIRDAIMEWLGFTKETDDKTGEVSWKLNDGYTNLEKIRDVLLTIAGIKVVGGILGVLTGTNKLGQALGIDKLIEDIGKLGELMSENGVFGGISKFFGESGIGKSISTLKSGFGGIGEAISALPLGKIALFAAGIAAIAGAFIYAYNNDEEFKKSVDELVTIVGGVLKDALDIVLELIKWGWESVLKPLWNNIIKPLASLLVDILTPVFKVIVSMLSAMFSVLSPMIQLLKPFITVTLDILKKVLEWIFDILENIIIGVKDFWNITLKPLADFISGIFSGFAKKFKETGDKLREFANKFKEEWERVKEKFKLPELKIPKFPKIKLEVTWNTNVGKVKKAIYEALGLDGWPSLKFSTYAQGGLPPAGQLFVANEKGPELVGHIGGQSFVANQNQMFDLLDKKIQGKGTSVNPTIIVQVGNRELAKQVITDLQDIAQTNGQAIRIGGN